MADIARFTLVQIATSSSGKPTVVAWSPGASEQPALSTSNKLLGVTMTASNDTEPVAVMKHGYMRGVPGSSWSVGDSLWGTSGGTVSKTRPAAPLTQVFVGTVYESEGGGLYSVNVDVRILPSIGELSGVAIETPADKDVFIYESGSTLWRPRRLAAVDSTYTGSSTSGSLAGATVQAAIDELAERDWTTAFLLMGC